MPRGKKNPNPGGAGSVDNVRNGTDAAPGAAGPAPMVRGRPRGRRQVAEVVVAVGAEAGGVPVALPGTNPIATGLQTTALPEQLSAVQRQLTEITRQAQDARAAVQSLRDEREQIGRELGELRQQVRAAQEQSLRETREGYSKVGHELNSTAGRLGEAVRNAQQELADVVRQAREARRELEELRRQSVESRQGEVIAPVVTAPAKSARGSRTKTRPVAAEHRNRLGVTVGNGVVVADVLPESPAAAAGLTRGDVIEEVNGTGVVSAVQLRDAVRKAAADEWLTLRVFRGGATHELRAKIAADRTGNRRDADRDRLGVTVGPGVVVAEVLPDTPAALAGLATGDVLDDLNGRPIHSAHELRDLVHRTHDGDNVVLRVTRAGEVREVGARLGAR
jgi:uncharacterized protein YukE